MKKPLKTIGWTLLIFSILFVGYTIYVYQSNPMIKAIVDNDESKLYYRPSTEMLAMEDLNYFENRLEVEDSISIYTYEFKPTKSSKGNIFLVRGNSGNITTYRNSIKPLVDNGFRVYSLDWRGYGKSTGVPNYKGVLKDTQVAFSHFLTNMNTDSLKTIVYGMSLGGQIATKITKDNQEQVDALILDGTLESAHSFLLDNVSGLILPRLIKNASEFNQDYVAVNDIADILNIPKLIIHSRSDRAVPIARGENVFAAAREPKEFWETNTAHIATLEVLTDEAMVKIHELIR